MILSPSLLAFLFIVPPPTATYTLSLHDALPISGVVASPLPGPSGNVEYFLWLRHGEPPLREDDLRRFTVAQPEEVLHVDRKSTRLNSSHRCISYAVFCLKKKKKKINNTVATEHH